MAKWIWKPPNSPYWHYRFTIGGQRYGGSTGKADERDAQRVAVEAHAAAARNPVSRRDPTQPPAADEVTFGDVALRYMKDVGRFLSGSADLEVDLVRLAEWIGPDTMVSQIDNAMVGRVVSNRRMMNKLGREDLGRLAPSTVNRTTIDVLRRVLNFARDVLEIDDIRKIAWAKHRLREPDGRRRQLTITEEAAFSAALGDDYRLPFEFAILSGLRLQNFIELRWSQVDIDSRLITVVQKGARRHTIPISDPMLEILERQRGLHPDAVFTFTAVKTWENPKTGAKTIRGRRYPCTYSGFVSCFRRVRAELKLDIRIHDLRRTAASRLVRETGSLKAAQQLLGHSNPTVTAKHYAHLLVEDLRDMMTRTALRSRQGVKRDG